MKRDNDELMTHTPRMQKILGDLAFHVDNLDSAMGSHANRLQHVLDPQTEELSIAPEDPALQGSIFGAMERLVNKIAYMEVRLTSMTERLQV